MEEKKQKDEREKLIDSKIDKGRCKILEEHIEKDPDGISKNNNHPDETSLCNCGVCAPLCTNYYPQVWVNRIDN